MCTEIQELSEVLVIGKEAPAVDADLTHRGAGMMMQGADAILPSHASRDENNYMYILRQ